jgi:hypothetical protein
MPAAISRIHAIRRAAREALATIMNRSSASRVTIRSSMIPASAFVEQKGVFAGADGLAAASTGQPGRSGAPRPSPDLDSRMCEMSNRPACARRVQMLFHHAERIGNRHLPAGKRREFRTRALVHRLERQLFEGFRSRHRHLSVRQHNPAVARRLVRPSVGSLRDSHSRNPVGNTYTFGAGQCPDFPECLDLSAVPFA